MTTLATQPVDNPDELALFADNWTSLHKPFADAFREACKTVAHFGHVGAGLRAWRLPREDRADGADHGRRVEGQRQQARAAAEVGRVTENQCQAAPTITKIGDFLLIECAACGDSWTTPVIKVGSR